MEYIHKFLKPNSKIIEIGAGTGRYSIALAKEGYNVTAVELQDVNIKVLKKNSKGIKNIKSYQGDALDLSQFKDNSFDMVLVLGPLYHLYTKKEQLQAIYEAIRIAKKDAIIMFAYLPTASFIYDGWLELGFIEGIKENYTNDYKVKHHKSQVFTGFELDEFDNLFNKTNTEKITTVSVDSIMSIVERLPEFKMNDEVFEEFFKYHLSKCEQREVQGFANHLLYICKKL